MRGILRVALMVLLAAAAGVGIAQGKWKDYTPSAPDAITWQYEQINTTNTCRIKPKDKSSISGRVKIPAVVTDGGAPFKGCGDRFCSVL